MILLWGSANDPPLAAVLVALTRRSARVVLIDEETAACSVELIVDPEVRGSLCIDGVIVDLAAVDGVYVRPGAPRAGAEPAAVHEALWAFSEVTPAIVLNRPAAMAGNGSKPYQAAQARAVGLATPETLVTTSADAARAFAAEHDDVIYKSTSGVRSVVATLDVSDDERFADLESCPTQLQQRIAGIDVRVHVVGPLIFACEVRSSAVDYRYAARDGLDVEIRSTELPPDVAARCLTLAALTELPVAGIDLRRTVDDAWYFFEINPSPGFTYYAEATGQPVGDAIAELLLAA
jgi:glutathione synthase/RimK-type ligase-like ATP-grasp enzyme